MKEASKARSIRRELTLRILIGALAMLLVAGSVFYAVIHRQLVADFDRLLTTEADMLMRNAERKGRTIVWDVPDSYSRGSLESADPPFCQLFLEDATVVGLSQTLGVDDLPRLAGAENGMWNASLPNGRRGRLIQRTFLPTFDQTEAQSSPEDPSEQTFTIPESVSAAGMRLVLVVARSREGVDRLLASLLLTGSAVAVALSCALAWLVRRLIARGLQPIEEINAQLAALGETVAVPFGTFQGCVRTREWSMLESGTTKKWYAHGVGFVRSESTGGEVSVLISITRK